jgi:hypothetical protein
LEFHQSQSGEFDQGFADRSDAHPMPLGELSDAESLSGLEAAPEEVGQDLSDDPLPPFAVVHGWLASLAGSGLLLYNRSGFYTIRAPRANWRPRQRDEVSCIGDLDGNVLEINHQAHRVFRELKWRRCPVWRRFQILALASAAVSGAETGFPPQRMPLLTRYCCACHSGNVPESGLNLTTRATDLPDADAQQGWVGAVA